MKTGKGQPLRRILKSALAFFIFSSFIFSYSPALARYELISYELLSHYELLSQQEAPSRDQISSRDPSEILNKIKTKYDNFSKEVKDLKLQMSIETDAAGPRIKAEQTVLKKGEKIRVDSRITVQQAERTGKSIFIFDGKNSWVISPEKGTTQQLPAEKAEEFKTEENWWDSAMGRATIKGEEKLGERDALVIEVADEKGGPPASLWVDKKDLVLLQAKSISSDGKTSKWVFSDFKRINNWDMPWRTEMYVGDALQSTSVIRSFEINTGFSEEVFSPQSRQMIQ
jgi:outer membrane lipoprotein-sorting protein